MSVKTQRPAYDAAAILAALKPVDDVLDGLLAKVRTIRAEARRALISVPKQITYPASARLPNGDELAARRTSLGVSQGELARCAHISRGQLSSVETGHRTGIETRWCVYQALLTLEAARSEAAP